MSRFAPVPPYPPPIQLPTVMEPSSAPAGPVEIACVVDRSGSMDAVRTDAIGGFNSFLRQQQALPGEARLSLVLFNHGYERVHDRRPLAEVPPLDEATYVPGGTTALLDAVGRTLHDLGNRIEAAPPAERPEKVIVAILTDGLENASRDYTYERVAGAIEDRQAAGWEFVFLAANQDAIASAARVGIGAQDAFGFVADAAGTGVAFARMAEEVSRRRGTPRS